MSFPDNNEQHGANYAAGSANPVYVNQNPPHAQHGDEYQPGSTTPAYADPMAAPNYNHHSPHSGHYGYTQDSRRQVAPTHSDSPVSPQSVTSQLNPQPGHYPAQPQPVYGAHSSSSGYSMQYPDPGSHHFPTYPPQTQGQYPNHMMDARGGGGHPSYAYGPQAIPGPSSTNHSGGSYGQGMPGQGRNGPRQRGYLKGDQAIDVEAAGQDGVAIPQKNGRRPHIPLKGYGNLFGQATAFRSFKNPHFYKPADYMYTSAEKFRSKDAMLRFREGVLDDRYISPYNGRTEELVVQAVDDIYNGNTSEGTWNRTFIRDISPWHLRLANWPESHIPYTARVEGRVTWKQKTIMTIKYVPAAVALVAVIAFPGNIEGEVRNGGRYDAFPYKFHGYSKVARNLLEEKIVREHVDISQRTQAVMTNRVLKPRKICLIDVEPTSTNPDGIKTIDYEDDMALPYLFAAYTAEQFPNSDEYNELLVRMEAKAARENDLKAFWISCCCMDTSLNRQIAGGKVLQEDVFRISDVVRGAAAVAILVGPPPNGDEDCEEDKRLGRRLRQWGARLWTFPEVLLCPTNIIQVYNVGQSRPINMHKNQIARLIWPDKEVSRQLIDHYEGTLALSRLELVTIALECLFSRQHREFLKGDHAYALMGLLRVRPRVDETDSGFQAFARLSLANDSDLLLERLTCVLPRDPNQPWYIMDDAYGASLWDIYPSCQIAGVGDDNTIIVDGARGANVRWKSFASVHVHRRWSWTRLLWRLLLHTSSLALIIGAILLWIANWIKRREERAADTLAAPFEGIKKLSDDTWDDIQEGALKTVKAVVHIVINEGFIKGFGVIFMLWALSMSVFAPAAIRTLYGGKLWNTQPWLFGFEGYLPINQIEYLIFGDERNRLRWHPFGSPLSKHQVDKSWKESHCDPVDPTTDPAVKKIVEDAKTNKLGDQKIFTLVDTNTMTVTMFTAARPPVCFLLLGAEGGMQRAVGCSFDWTTGILYRETVLRIETSCRDKMDLVSRARISLERRKNPGVQQAAQRPKFTFKASSEKFGKRTETESG